MNWIITNSLRYLKNFENLFEIYVDVVEKKYIIEFDDESW